jgi:hypothetical protein
MPARDLPVNFMAMKNRAIIMANCHRLCRTLQLKALINGCERFSAMRIAMAFQIV